jgi:hypothetical protein
MLAMLALTTIALLFLALATPTTGPLQFVWGSFGSDGPADYRTSISSVAPVRAEIKPAQ